MKKILIPLIGLFMISCTPKIPVIPKAPIVSESALKDLEKTQTGIDDSLDDNKKIKEFLLSININEIYFYYYKILFNAFEMNNNSVILSIGATMNHSCKPNIIFKSININGINYMEFKAINNIKINDELCYSYLRNYKGFNNKLYLLNHYNFICQCIKCNKLNMLVQNN